MPWKLPMTLALLVLVSAGCGSGGPAAVQTLQEAEDFCKARGVALSGMQAPSQGDIKARIYKAGAVNVAMTQFNSADETKNWVEQMAKMPGGQSSALAVGAVAILLTGGSPADREKIVKVLQ